MDSLRRPLLLLLFAAVLLISFQLRVLAEDNLAPNSSFENNVYADYSAYGNGLFFHVPEGLSDSMALKIMREEDDLTDSFGRWISKTTIIEVPEESHEFAFSVWVRGENIEPEGAQIYINFWGEDGVSSYLGGEGLKFAPTEEWERVKINTSYIPANAKFVRIEIRLLGSGTLWADEVELLVVEEEPEMPPEEIEATYFVDVNGDDANIGSLEQPLKTIQHAADIAQPGDIIMVRGGVYTETINILHSGLPEEPIVFTNFPDELPIIDGAYERPLVPNSGWARCSDHESPSVCFHYESLVDIQGDYIVFNGFEIKESLGRGIRVFNDEKRPQHIEITNNIVHDIRGAAILIYHADFVLVEGNEVFHAGNFAPYDRPSTVLGWPGAISGNNANDVIYRRNHVYENWTEGIMPSSQHGSSNIIVDNNIVWDNRALNIYVHRLANAVIEGNVVYCTGNPDFDRGSNYTHGIVLANELQFDGGTVTENVQIHNNLVAGCRDGISIWNANPNYELINISIAHNTLFNLRSKIEDKPGIALNLLSNNNNGVLVQNNIVQLSLENTPLQIVGGANLRIDHNLWSDYPLSYAFGEGSIIATADFVAPLIPTDNSGLDVNGFKLLESSPAIDSGSSDILLEFDFFDSLRDETPDMGFYEFDE